MRNSIMNGKKGGAATVFTCLQKRTANHLCIKDFSNTFKFKFENVPADGNCFFVTLEKYYKNKDIIKPYKELREKIIQYILDNWNFYSDYGIDQDDIIDFLNDGVWNIQLGDFVVPAAARALNLTINLYDIKPASKNPPIEKRIIKYTYPELEPRPVEEINILRINDNHFGLLTPVIYTTNIPKVVSKRTYKKKQPSLPKTNVTKINTNKINNSKSKPPIHKYYLRSRTKTNTTNKKNTTRYPSPPKTRKTMKNKPMPYISLKKDKKINKNNTINSKDILQPLSIQEV
jgi:hypothetical protein